jgi:hypothetical protein
MYLQDDNKSTRLIRFPNSNFVSYPYLAYHLFLIL